MLLQDAQEIAAIFEKSISTDDQSLIENYSILEIKQALSVLPNSDSKWQWYKEMERRIAELDRIEEREKVKKDEKPTRYDLFVNSIKNHPVFVPVLLFFALIGVVSSAILGVETIGKSIDNFGKWVNQEQEREVVLKTEYDEKRKMAQKIFPEFLVNSKKISAANGLPPFEVKTIFGYFQGGRPRPYRT